MQTRKGRAACVHSKSVVVRCFEEDRHQQEVYVIYVAGVDGNLAQVTAGFV